MACLDHQMYSPSSDQMSPRISFSNDFAESTHHLQRAAARPPPPPQPSAASDFEFSVASAALHQLPADELFSKGRILPLKSSGRFQNPPQCSSTTTTLRDELLSGDGEDEHGDGLSPLGSSNKPPLKGRWKGFLGLRKHHFPAKKAPETPANSHAMFAFPLQDPALSRPPQGGGSKDMDTKM